jgi:hypothetical protein
MSFFKPKYRILKHRAGYLVQVKYWWAPWDRLDYGGEHNDGVFETYQHAARFVVREMTPISAERRAYILERIEQLEKELKAEVVWSGEGPPPPEVGGSA